jgi:hypothetical protein
MATLRVLLIGIAVLSRSSVAQSGARRIAEFQTSERLLSLLRTAGMGMPPVSLWGTELTIARSAASASLQVPVSR